MELAKQVWELAEKYAADTAENLGRLVRIPSLSCEEEAVNRELCRQMEAAGFSRVRCDGLGNALGCIGEGERLLVVDGHMDTVAVGNRDNWSFDPYCGSVADGWVLGRGSVDQKGGPAAAVTAGRILRELGFDRDLTFCLSGTVMEEDCDGLCWKYLVEEEKLQPELVICSEPTSLGLYRGQRGRMEIEAVFKGVSAHGSAPERGRNAVYAASRACLACEALNQQLPSDPFLGKGSVTVTRFESDGPSLCAVPDYARIHLDRRLTTGETREGAVAEVERACSGLEATVGLLDYRERAWTGLEYGMEKYYPSWQIPADHPAIRTGQAVGKALFGTAPAVGHWVFSTNGVTINGLYGIPVVGFGPGDEAMAHAPDERVAVEDLVKASAFYALFALTY